MARNPSVARSINGLPLTIVATLFLLVIVAGCGGGGDQAVEQKEQQSGLEEIESAEQEVGSAEESFTGTFIGEDIFVIDDNSEVGAFLALVAQEPGDGEGQQEVRAFLSDGRVINEWFSEGSVEGIEFDLISESGAQLLGSLKRDVDSAWISGQIFLADGTVLGFGIPPATGIAGLYEVTISGSGLSGTSDDGGRLEGRIGDAPQEDGLYPVSGVITAPDGQSSQDFQVLATRAASGELRWIVLADGRVKGAPKKGEGAGFIQSDIDP
jgi:hypothetical protein